MFAAILNASSPGLEQSMGGGVFNKDEQGTVFSLTLVKGVLKMPLIPNTAVLQRIATLPLQLIRPAKPYLPPVRKPVAC